MILIKKSPLSVLILIMICIHSSHGQSKKHPSSDEPSQFSETTDREIYTYSSVYEIDMLLLKEANDLSEKNLFYEGFFDAFKHKDNKQNILYFQTYIVPPHTLPILKRVYMDITEVANIHYQEFLHFVDRDSGQQIHDSYLPRLDEHYMNDYYNNPEFYYFPVVGINYESAKTYCEWRAKNLNEGLKIFLENENSYAKYKYLGRLPTEHEWRRAAGKISTSIYDKTYEISKKAEEFLIEDVIRSGFADESILESDLLYGYNVNLDHGTQFSHQMQIPYYIYGFEPKTTGFYNMYGNVKEIVNEGYAIGGSYKSKKSHHELLEKHSDFEYQTDIGFRCVTRVVK